VSSLPASLSPCALPSMSSCPSMHWSTTNSPAFVTSIPHNITRAASRANTTLGEHLFLIMNEPNPHFLPRPRPSVLLSSFARFLHSPRPRLALPQRRGTNRVDVHTSLVGCGHLHGVILGTGACASRDARLPQPLGVDALCSRLVDVHER